MGGVSMNENTLYRFGFDIGDCNDYTAIYQYGELFDFHLLFNKGMLVRSKFEANNPFQVIGIIDYHKN